ncbi:unnamed protein product [Dicrocoelium dendriticum]|nr:unnamed protein product [Dicrocoelium dendriticum]
MRSRDLLPGIITSVIGYIFVSITSVCGLSSHELCASKVCSGCIAGSLSCQEGGLNRLPDKLAADIQSIILIGHRFDVNFLTERNFSNYPQQTQLLQRLTLRNCGIERLFPGTFKSLKSLAQLDLSQNRLQTIEPRTFIGLNLELLRLDENPGLYFSSEAFHGVSIVSLSVSQCGLRSLTYSDLAPLFENKVLTNLHLSGNKLITLESQLASWFSELQSLSLEQNPFVCDCRLRWLTDVLQQRLHRLRTRGLPNGVGDINYFNDQTPSKTFTATQNDKENAPLDEDLLKPVCRAPERLAGRLIEKLTHRDFYCDLPQLQAIEVDLSHSNQMPAESSLVTPHQMDAITKSLHALRVSLRCVVKGSPEVQLSWYRRQSPELLSHLGLRDKVEELYNIPNSRERAPGVVEVYLTHPYPRPSHSLTQVGLTNGADSVEKLVCLATDLNGNTSTEVRLRWPSHFAPELTLNELHDMGVAQSKYIVAELENPSHPQTTSNFPETTPAAINTRLRPDWYLLTGEDPNGFWLQKQFSTIQMIGAVVGTFTVTLLLFIFGILLLRFHRFHQTCFRSRILLQYCKQQHSPPCNKYPIPPSYSTTAIPSAHSFVYPGSSVAVSELQTSFGQQSSYQMSPINFVKENGLMTTEVNQNRRINYAAYMPVTAHDVQSAATYSDSSTYDLPNLPQALSHPRVPLPPVPMPSNQQLIALGAQAFETFDHTMLNTSQRSITDPIQKKYDTSCTPMIATNADQMSAALAMAATLNRLRSSPLIQGQLPFHSNRTLNRQSVVSPVSAHNKPFTFVNQSHK